jgi:hypothetical protein
MDMSKSMLRAMFLFLALLTTTVTPIAITGYQHCPIPYVVPRAFESKCDPMDQFISEDMIPTIPDPGSNFTVHPAQFMAAKYIKTIPDIWNLEPWCMFSFDLNKEICVYSSTAFGKNRGISIIAQMEEEQFITRATALRRQHTYAWPEYVNPTTDMRVEKTPIAGKGLGVRAKQMLLRGDAAQSYTPVVAVQDSIMQMEKQPWERNLALKVAVQRLPTRSMRLFEELMGQFGGDAYYDRVNTNGFNAMIGDSGVFFWSVYPETSVSFMLF